MTTRSALQALSVVLAGLVASADAAHAACSPEITQKYRDTQVRAQVTVPLLLRNAFDAEGTETVGLGLQIELPAAVAGRCPPAWETVTNIRKSPDGMLHGTVMWNGLSTNTGIFMTDIDFSPDAILDWTFRDLSTFPVRTYGTYLVRPLTDEGREIFGLTEQNVPADWR